jgi:prepilin-type N-terminal cleavage/methylation domain-containing protein
MNRIKNIKGQRGFTLVEVIVVAIIVAALAAVAVPMYTSYVKDSRTNAAANAAGSVAAFMGVCLNLGGKIASAVDTDGKTQVTITCTTPSETDVNPQMQLPIGIKIGIDVPDGTGTVTASHIDGGETSTYKY